MINIDSLKYLYWKWYKKDRCGQSLQENSVLIFYQSSGILMIVIERPLRAEHSH